MRRVHLLIGVSTLGLGGLVTACGALSLNQEDFEPPDGDSGIGGTTATGGTGGHGGMGGGLSGSSGSGGEQGTGGNPLSCIDGFKGCIEQTALICTAEKEWQFTPCVGDTPVCLEGECIACVPGTSECVAPDNTSVRVCKTDNKWDSPKPCPDQTECSNGICSPRSCVQVDPLMANNCGPNGMKHDCCESLLVPGGTYNRSNDPDFPATVSDFHLDRYEVTVSRFREFVNANMGINTPMGLPSAGDGAHPLIDGSGWQTDWNTHLLPQTSNLTGALNCGSAATWADTIGKGNNENLPINCVTWYEAFAFCAWDGGRLPTEAEWNYAAAGGGDQRLYPWGPDVPTDKHAVFNLDSMTGKPAFVGSKSSDGDARWGHADMAGNVFEWTLDGYAAPYLTPCDNCSMPFLMGMKPVARGGGYMSLPIKIQTDSRGAWAPTDRYSTIGIRCAR